MCCALPVPHNLWAVDDLDTSRAQMLCGHKGGDKYQVTNVRSLSGKSQPRKEGILASKDATLALYSVGGLQTFIRYKDGDSRVQSTRLYCQWLRKRRQAHHLGPRVQGQLAKTCTEVNLSTNSCPVFLWRNIHSQTYFQMIWPTGIILIKLTSNIYGSWVKCYV